ncbi:ABC transporter permease [Opitutus terrae]|uniref:Permease n=1 Tax=Opitutus terrae (strain DSM 11246 / JCM 15787 / PB90-1) TaxID=452637 RepID=B1ZXX7_OPITP|nr:ABC transporter permease [Opitutus terrae]ACB75179.1 permease [Opitutus terrae PB90-1]
MFPLRYAFRSLAKSPGYTAIALVTLALGIGVNTSMFSIIDALLFRAAPYAEPEKLVQLTGQLQSGPLFFGRFSAQEVREIAPQATGFAALTAYDRTMATLAAPGQPAERLLAIRFTRGAFETLRVAPLLGRTFTAEEFQPGRDQVAMLTESAWRARFAADPAIIGRTLRLDGEIVTIVGVLPARAEYRVYWGGASLWRPLNFTPDQLNFRGYRQFWVIGRLQPDVTPAAIEAQLAPLAARQTQEFPRDYPGLHYEAAPLNERVLDNVRRNMSWMLLGLAGFVLLIGCANLANLQLARATGSVRDFAIRAALGASRRHLIAQQLTESLLLSLAGGALGLLLAGWLNTLAEHALLVDGAPGFTVDIDARILALTLLISVFTGVLFGLVPALIASRPNVVATLKAQGRGSTGTRSQQRLRHALIIGEVTLALVLLAGAAIINRGLARMLARESGWDTGRVLTAILPIPETRYPTAARRVEFFHQLEEKLAAIPGVEHAALATSLPLLVDGTTRQVFVDAPAADGSAAGIVAVHQMVTSDYFSAMGIRLLEGHAFPRDLQPDGPAYILVNETLARHFWPNESAVGKRLGSVQEGQPVWREVIGVVRDVEPVASAENPTTRLTVYRPLVQEPWSYVNVVLRAAPGIGAVETLAEPLRRAIAAQDPDLAADFVVSVRTYVAAAQSNMILVGRLLIGFAVLGLVLAAVGLYGVISHTVAQRLPEFGIRLALGALPRDLLRQVLIRGVRLTTFGLALGLVGALVLGRLLGSIMPRLARPDPLGLAGVVLLLLVVTVVACWFPAQRAMRANPLDALRAE